jgi:UDP-N-acetylmuramate dehydrogenase
MSTLSSLNRELRALNGVRTWTAAALAPFTTIGTGGKAELLVTVASTDAVVAVLKLLRAHDIPWFCLGAGSDLLVADGGYAGAAVKLDKDFQYVEGLPAGSVTACGPVVITVGAAAPLAGLAAMTAEAGLAGLEFACGIPGSVGGGVAMNAGANGSSLVDVVMEVELADAEGVRWVPAAELAWGYRCCGLPQGVVVTAARFELVPGDCGELTECQRITLRKRRTVQPQGVRTFGSSFKNPSGGAAGRLIDAAGLKGERLGGAEVSSVHANFVVNLGEATTSDVIALMCRMRERVHQICGVLLEPEVKLVGAVFPWETSGADPQGPPTADG